MPGSRYAPVVAGFACACSAATTAEPSPNSPASPPIRAASTQEARHVGPYDKLGDASSALHEFCRTHDHPIAGPTWEEYGHWNEDPSKLRTDVFVRVAR